jgi:predicted phage tail protein
MLCKVMLYGSLADDFGKEHIFDVKHVVDVARALAANFKDFLKKFNPNSYHIFINDDNIDEKEIQISLSKGDVVHIHPAVQGSKGGGGFLKSIIGAVIAAVGIATGQAWAVSLGVSLMISGVSILLSPKPRVQKEDYLNRESPDQRPSFIFNGATNRSIEGSTVPIVYGNFLIGTITISAGLSVEQI